MPKTAQLICAVALHFHPGVELAMELGEELVPT